MKISKTAAAAARRLFGLCQSGGRLDESKLRQVIAQLVESKVRDYRPILAALQRLIRIELDRRKVLIESAVEMDEPTRQRVVAGLAEKYGADLEVRYQITPSLLGGLRIRVGDDVFDGSVQGRIDRFASAF
jgi:F-type H+-transporting ATPase subunit delta